MRSKHKEWKNGPGGKWDARITWYQGPEPLDIRLRMEDCEGMTNVYPESREEADHLWFQFKTGAVKDQLGIPFVTDLLNLMAKKYPHLTRFEKAPSKAVMGRVRCGKYTYETQIPVREGDRVLVEVSKEWQDKLGETRETTVTSIDPGDYEGPCCSILKVIEEVK